MSSMMPSHSRLVEDPQYLFGGYVHISSVVYALLGLSCLCSMAAIPFFNSVAFMVVIGVTAIAVHAIVGLAVHQHWIHVIRASLMLWIIFYSAAFITMIVQMFMEVFQSRRGSFKLPLLHAASLSGPWTNVLMFLIVATFKLIGVYTDPSVPYGGLAEA